MSWADADPARATRALTRPAIAVALFVMFVVAAAACGSDGSDVAISPGDGAALYAANCALCHGTDLRGTEMGPSQLSMVYEPGHHPDDSFRAAISNGVTPHHWQFGPMPPVAGLDDDEIDAIIAHIRDIQKREGFEPYPPD